jgi:tellurite resistance protein
MFNLTDETRTAIITILREQFPLDEYTDDKINAVIDEVVSAVKAQFGF